MIEPAYTIDNMWQRCLRKEKSDHRIYIYNVNINGDIQVGRLSRHTINARHTTYRTLIQHKYTLVHLYPSADGSRSFPRQYDTKYKIQNTEMFNIRGKAALLAVHIQVQHAKTRRRRIKRKVLAPVFILFIFCVVGAVGDTIAQRLSSDDARCRTLR